MQENIEHKKKKKSSQSGGGSRLHHTKRKRAAGPRVPEVDMGGTIQAPKDYPHPPATSSSTGGRAETVERVSDVSDFIGDDPDFLNEMKNLGASTPSSSTAVLDDDDDDEDFDNLSESMESLDTGSSGLGAGTILALFLKSAGSDPTTIAQRVIADSTYLRGLSTLLNRVANAENKSFDRADYSRNQPIDSAARAISMIADKQVVKHLSAFECINLVCEKVPWTCKGNIITWNDKEVIKLEASPLTPTILNVAPLVRYFNCDIQVHETAPRIYYWAVFNGAWRVGPSSVIYDLAALPTQNDPSKQPLIVLKASSRSVALTEQIKAAREILAKVINKTNVFGTDIFSYRRLLIQALKQRNYDSLFTHYDAYVDKWYKTLSTKEYFTKHHEMIMKNLNSFVSGNKMHRKHLGAYGTAVSKMQVTPEFDYDDRIVCHLPRRHRPNSMLRYFVNAGDIEWTDEAPYQDLTKIGWAKYDKKAKWIRCQWFNPMEASETLPDLRFISVKYEQMHSLIVYLEVSQDNSGHNFQTIMLSAALRIYIGEMIYMRELLLGRMNYSSGKCSTMSWTPLGTSSAVNKTKDFSFDFEAVDKLLGI